MTEAAWALVFPTRVGVNRAKSWWYTSLIGFPHARGGEPSRDMRSAPRPSFSPRAWG